MMEWTDALRKYASMKGIKWRIYKKGSAEYAEIKKLQAEGGSAKKSESGTPIKDRMLARLGKGKEVKEKPLEEARMMLSESGGQTLLVPQPGGYKSPSLYSKEALKKADKVKAKKAGKSVRKVRSDKGKKRGKICKEQKADE